MDGIDLAAVIVGLLLLLAAERIAAWRTFDRYRRLERRVHLNLTRGQR